MITTRRKVIRKAFKYRPPIVAYLRRFAVHEHRCTNDVATERLADRLMAKTNTEYRNLPSKAIDHPQRNTRIVWCSGSGRDNDSLGLQSVFDFIECHLIVATHLDLLAKFT